MKAKSALANRPTDFALQKIDEWLYVHHLPTQTIFYVHSALSAYPPEIDERRYHHPIRFDGINTEFSIIISSTLSDPSVMWIVVLLTESWFRKEGITACRNCYKKPCQI